MEKLILIAGPCVVESEKITMHIAREVVRIASHYDLDLIFKASYRKANRTSGSSFSGIGDAQALSILAKVKKEFGVRVTTDIHTAEEANLAAEYVDVLQIPAFLCRQTDLLVAAGSTGKTVNIKKGQFASAGTMDFARDKVRSSGNENLMLTERGTFFGYNDLVVDMRNIPLMKKTGVPVIVDITHSLQQPNQPGGFSGGNPEMIETIGKCAVAAGADGIFLETHPSPSEALSDGLSMLPMNRLEDLIKKLVSVRKAVL
jgi:2-dehydro-3-deoxyphosphooctonate aldolase (KDO 8-P synthase)